MKLQVVLLAYVEGEKFASVVGKTNASALILPQDKTLQLQAQERGIAWVATPDPKTVICQSYPPVLPTISSHSRNSSHCCDSPHGKNW